MNKENSIIVEKIINQQYELVRLKILDPGFFKKWWEDYNITIDKDLSVIYFRPLPFIKIKLQLRKITDNSIWFSYTEGPFNGIGYWEINKIDQRKTKVSYSVRLSGKNKLIQTLIKTQLFKWKHSKDILKLIKKLELM